MNPLNAFEKYLLTLPERLAVQVVYEALSSPGGDLAWDLMERINGENWKASDGREMYLLIAGTINQLRDGEPETEGEV